MPAEDRGDEGERENRGPLRTDTERESSEPKASYVIASKEASPPNPRP